jgi:hypothetical protein
MFPPFESLILEFLAFSVVACTDLLKLRFFYGVFIKQFAFGTYFSAHLCRIASNTATFSKRAFTRRLLNELVKSEECNVQCMSDLSSSERTRTQVLGLFS